MAGTMEPPGSGCFVTDFLGGCYKHAQENTQSFQCLLNLDLQRVVCRLFLIDLPYVEGLFLVSGATGNCRLSLIGLRYVLVTSQKAAVPS